MVVIGLGSPFLCDDSIGPRVVRALAGQVKPGVRLVEAHAGGLLLLEELDGAEHAILVDALVDERRKPGEVLVCGVESTTRNASCGHDCSLAEALVIGRAMGMKLPPDGAITLVAIVAEDVSTFSEQLTPAVAAALESACETVCRLAGLELR
jgi:hydrogenase maturation protease